MGNRPVYGIYTSMEATSLREWELHASPCILSIQWAIHCPFEGPLWVAKGAAFSVYTPGHHSKHTISPAAQSPSPAPPPSVIRHPPHTLTITHHIPNHHPPNPRPSLHPIPDHHSTQSPTTTPAHSMRKVSQVRLTLIGNAISKGS